jgi:hypothetical protein
VYLAQRGHFYEGLRLAGSAGGLREPRRMRLGGYTADRSLLRLMAALRRHSVTLTGSCRAGSEENMRGCSSRLPPYRID